MARPHYASSLLAPVVLIRFGRQTSFLPHPTSTHPSLTIGNTQHNVLLLLLLLLL
jgi:hypothetical protein